MPTRDVSTDWMLILQMHGSAGWLVGLFVGCWVCWLVVGSAGWLVGLFAGWLFCLLVVGFAGWLDVLLVGY